MASKIKVDQLEGSTGSTITIPTGQTFTVTDGIPVASGGTGLASFTAGDILYATGATTLTKLNKGTAEQVLAMNSGATAPDWGSVDLTVLPTISVAKGGTNLASFTAGDILYATGSTTLAKLAKGTGSQTLKMNSGATAPEWATVAAASADYVKLGTGTVSNASSFSIDGLYSATYKFYEYRIRGIYGATNGQTIKLQFNTSGSAYTGAAYRGVMAGGYWQNTGATASQSGGSWGATYIPVTNVSDDVEMMANGVIQVYDPQNAGTRTYTTFLMGGAENNVMYVRSGHGYHDANSAHTGITLSIVSGNIYVAECNVYGVK